MLVSSHLNHLIDNHDKFVYVLIDSVIFILKPYTSQNGNVPFSILLFTLFAKQKLSDVSV